MTTQKDQNKTAQESLSFSDLIAVLSVLVTVLGIAFTFLTSRPRLLQKLLGLEKDVKRVLAAWKENKEKTLAEALTAIAESFTVDADTVAEQAAQADKTETAMVLENTKAELDAKIADLQQKRQDIDKVNLEDITPDAKASLRDIAQSLNADSMKAIDYDGITAAAVKAGIGISAGDLKALLKKGGFVQE